MQLVRYLLVRDVCGFAEGERSRGPVGPLRSTARSCNARSMAGSSTPGDFTCPGLAEVREAAGTASSATHLTVSPVATQDIGAGHAGAVTNGALIQAASQFNCLEMTSDRVTTDQG